DILHGQAAVHKGECREHPPVLRSLGEPEYVEGKFKINGGRGEIGWQAVERPDGKLVWAADVAAIAPLAAHAFVFAPVPATVRSNEAGVKFEGIGKNRH